MSISRTNSSTPPLMVNPSSNNDWRMLLNTLMARDIPADQYQIEETNRDLHIRTTDIRFCADLNRVLHSPVSVLLNLQYALEETNTKSTSTTATAELPEFPEPLPLKGHDGHVIFDSLFKGVSERLGQMKWNGHVEKPDTFIVAATCESGLIELTKLQIEAYRRILMHASYAQLRWALSKFGGNSYVPLVFNNSGTGEEGILAQHINHILYCKDDGTVYFDYGLLYDCLTPPQIQMDVVPNSKEYVYTLKKSGLLSYLSIVCKEGFLLHLEGDQARPIAFSLKRGVAKKMIIELLLDISGSMAPEMENYQLQVCNFVEELAKQQASQNCEIRITAFNTQSKPTAIFPINKTEEIKTYIEQLVADNHTALFDAIADRLTAVQPETEEANVIVILFTDGEDTKSKDENKEHYADTLVGPHRPRIFSMGLGLHYLPEQLTAIAHKTGGEHTHLNSIEDFNNIFIHLKRMTIPRRLLDFIQTNSHRFTVEVPDGQLVVAPNTIDVNTSFQAGNRSYQITRRIAEPVAVATSATNASTSHFTQYGVNANRANKRQATTDGKDLKRTCSV